MRHAPLAVVCLIPIFIMGCVAGPDADPNAPQSAELDGQTSTAAITDGTPEAVGLLALLNDASTTLTVLDDDVRLDSRAAKNLVHHRDGFDQIPGTNDDNLFETIDEVDAVRYVGKSAMGKLLDFALSKGWVPQGDDVLGRWDGVSFTADEAARTLDFANRASHDLLDYDMGMDRRAADSIVEAQPIASIEVLAGLYYVGKTALVTLKEAAALENPGTSDQFNHDEATEIPDGDNYGVTTEVHVAGAPDQTTGVTLVIDLRHDALDQLYIELTTPNGESWEFDATKDGRYPVGAMIAPDGRWTLNVADKTDGVQGEVYGWAIELDTHTTKTVMQDRFALDLSWALALWYRSYGDDVRASGGNTLEEARAAITPGAVVEVTDPEDDPEGYDLATTLVLSHRDIVFPGGDTVWFAAYDRESGSLMDIYTFE